MRCPSVALGLAAVTLVGCGGLEPYGEAVIFVDTDLPVPKLAGRLRVDLYGADGGWYESRDVALPHPSDWPTSFSVFTDDEVHEKEALVRLRVYPDGKERDYRGERFEQRPTFAEPFVAHSIDELCASPPELALGEAITVRRGADPFVGQIQVGSDCSRLATLRGSAAAFVDVPEAGDYRFAILDVRPHTGDFVLSIYEQVTLLVRRQCDAPSSAVFCDSGVSPKLDKYSLPDHTEHLEPGRYFVLTGGSGALDGPADVTIGVARADRWSLVRAPVPPAQEPLPLEPLLRGDVDTTPRAEPEPNLTVDRLLRIRLVPGERGSARVTLRGACLGTMARLEAAAPFQRAAFDSAESCVDTEAVRVRVGAGELLGDLSPPAPSAQGSFGAEEPCQNIGGGARVCVPGGLFLLGGVDQSEIPSKPERVAVLSRFWIDRFEVSVGDWRAAVAQGFAGAEEPALLSNDGPLPEGASPSGFDDGTTCTYSASPLGGALEREGYPINCVSWTAARSYCLFRGGDLPTEAQWEYVASAVGRPEETRYPWGDDAPRCDCAGQEPPCHAPVFGRFDSSLLGGFDVCNPPGAEAFGPLPLSVDAGDTADLTPGLGVSALGGSMIEWLRDSAQRYDGVCWRAASLVDPICWEDEAPARSARGGSWKDNLAPTLTTLRGAHAPGYVGSSRGFRCVYPGPR